MQGLLHTAMIAFAIVAASCTLSMMSVFIGGAAVGDDLCAVVLLQMLAIPPALVITLLGIRRQGGVAIWQALSPWLVLAVLLLNGLVAIGELALLLRRHLTGVGGTWYEHAPLLAALACSAAVCVLYARRYPAAAGSPGGVRRW